MASYYEVITYIDRLKGQLAEAEARAQDIPNLERTIRDLQVELAASKDIAARMSTSIRVEVTNAVKERDEYWQNILREKDIQIHRLEENARAKRDSWESGGQEKAATEIETLRAAMEKAESLLYEALNRPTP